MKISLSAALISIQTEKYSPMAANTDAKEHKKQTFLLIYASPFKLGEI